MPGPWTSCNYIIANVCVHAWFAQPAAFSIRINIFSKIFKCSFKLSGPSLSSGGVLLLTLTCTERKKVGIKGGSRAIKKRD